MKKMTACLCLCWMLSWCIGQDVGIGTATPHASARLEIQSSNKGILVPRFALTSTTSSLPVNDPVDGLMIYNTETASRGENRVNPGFYMWNTAAGRWIPMRTEQTEANVGFGVWGECIEQNILGYNPVAASDGMANDSFGFSVAVSGDYAVIGAPYDDIGANLNQGSAYIFRHIDGVWVEQQKIVASDGQPDHFFGYSVGILEDKIVVGSPGNPTSIGTAYYFRNTGNTWLEQQKMTGNETNGRFGHSLAFNNQHLWIGEPNFTLNSGGVVTYTFNGTHWIFQYGIYAPPDSGNFEDYFGCSVALSDSVAIIGSYKADVIQVPDLFALDAGAAFLYRLNGPSWDFEQMVYSPSAAAGGEHFGNHVSISGDHAVVGSDLDDWGPNQDQGTVYVYRYENGSWFLFAPRTTHESMPDARYGHCVMVTPDYIITGVPKSEASGGMDSGQIYIHALHHSVPVYEFYKIIESPAGGPNHLFGNTCAVNSNRFAVGSKGAAGGRGIVTFGKIF